MEVILCMGNLAPICVIKTKEKKRKEKAATTYTHKVLETVAKEKKKVIENFHNVFIKFKSFSLIKFP